MCVSAAQARRSPPPPPPGAGPLARTCTTALSPSASSTWPLRFEPSRSVNSTISAYLAFRTELSTTSGPLTAVTVRYDTDADAAIAREARAHGRGGGGDRSRASEGESRRRPLPGRTPLPFFEEDAWRKWSASERPDYIPSNPDVTYRNKGWVGWPDWMGST